jgi:surface carbohydrate biosynthesis protein
MTARYLYILIEESFRELRSRLLVTNAALGLGYDVVLGQQWWFNVNFHRLPPGVVLLKGNNAIQASVMSQAKAAGHRVASIEEEIFGLQKSEVILPIFDPRVEHLCDLFLMQGTRHAEMLREHFPRAGDKIKVVGNPRTDVLRLSREAGPSGVAAEFARDKGRFVLINSNFGAINPYDYDALAFFSRCVSVGIIDPQNASDMELFHTRCMWERNNLREIVNFIQTMAQRHPEIPIAVRPHPAENHKIWRSEMSHYPSVHVIDDTDHVSWSLGSSCLVHSGSTTGLEAFLLGIPTIDICAKDSAWHHRFIAPVVNTVVDRGITAAEQVEDWFFRPVPVQERSAEEERRLEALQEFLRTRSDILASTMIANALDEIKPVGDGSVLRGAHLVALDASARHGSDSKLLFPKNVWINSFGRMAGPTRGATLRSRSSGRPSGTSRGARTHRSPARDPGGIHRDPLGQLPGSVQGATLAGGAKRRSHGSRYAAGGRSGDDALRYVHGAEGVIGTGPDHASAGSCDRSERRAGPH